MSTHWNDTLFVFAPLALLGVLVLAAGLISVATERAERRRARLFAPRPRARRFRPVVIEGGKMEPAVEDVPAPSISSLRA